MGKVYSAQAWDLDITMARHEQSEQLQKQTLSTLFLETELEEKESKGWRGKVE